MGIFSRFARPTNDLTGVEPTPAETQPTTRPPAGGSGRHHTRGFLDFDELNNKLRHPGGARIYETIWRSDPHVRPVLAMTLNPIIGGTWSMEPYGGDDATAQDVEAMELVEWALFEQLNNGLGLINHIAEAAPIVGRHGFAPFEQSWQAVPWKGKLRLIPRKLHARLPRSVTRWFQDEWEDLVAIEQFTIATGLTRLEAQDLVYYRAGGEGDNWEGTSLLRPVYKAYVYKDSIERLDGVAQERAAVGVTVVYPPAGVSEDDDIIDRLEQQIAGLRAGDTSYLIMPGPKQKTGRGTDGPETGWLIEIMGMGGDSGRDAQPSLNYWRDAIAAALIAEFMRIGQSGEGARATAETQQDPFLAAVEGFASTVIEPPLNALIRRVCDVNIPGLDGYPKLSMSKADGTSLTELKDFVLGLTQAGALAPDHPLEDYLRDRADLPPADPAERERQKQLRERQDAATADSAEAGAKSAQKAADAPTEPPPPPGDPTKKTAAHDHDAHTFRRQDRPLRGFEQHMQLDRIESTVDGARGRFEQAGAEAGRMAAALAARAIADDQDPGHDPPPELADAITTVLDDLYATGRQTVRDELRSQGAHVADVHALGDVPDWIRRRAKFAADNIWASIVRRLRGQSVSGGADHFPTDAELQQAGEETAAAGLRAEGQTNAMPALNQGRSDEADDHDEIAGSRYTSILDGNRCDVCSAADDDVLRPLTDPLRLARKPPNRMCEGGDRCRCLEFFQLRDEDPAAPGV